MSFVTRSQRILINSRIKQQENESLGCETVVMPDRLRKRNNPPKYLDDFIGDKKLKKARRKKDSRSEQGSIECDSNDGQRSCNLRQEDVATDCLKMTDMKDRTPLEESEEILQEASVAPTVVDDVPAMYSKHGSGETEEMGRLSHEGDVRQTLPEAQESCVLSEEVQEMNSKHGSVETEEMGRLSHEGDVTETLPEEQEICVLSEEVQEMNSKHGSVETEETGRLSREGDVTETLPEEQEICVLSEEIQEMNSKHGSEEAEEMGRLLHEADVTETLPEEQESCVLSEEVQEMNSKHGSEEAEEMGRLSHEADGIVTLPEVHRGYLGTINKCITVEFSEGSEWSSLDDSDRDPNYIPCSTSDSDETDSESFNLNSHLNKHGANYRSDESDVFPIYSIPHGGICGSLQGKQQKHALTGSRENAVKSGENSEVGGTDRKQQKHAVASSVASGLKSGENSKIDGIRGTSTDGLQVLNSAEGSREDRDSASESEMVFTSSKRCDRPARPCPFCGEFKVRLTRHIRTKHKGEEAVDRCLKTSLKEQRAAFKQLKRDGIMKHNVKIAGQKDAVLERERKSKYDGSAVVCDRCSGVFNRHWFSAHRKNCGTEQCSKPSAVATSVFFSTFKVPDDFKKEILSKFSNDEVGKLCQQNETIAMIGSKLFMKIKARKDKKMEVRRSVMTDMRRLGHVFYHFREIAQQDDSMQFTAADRVDVLDMFRRQNFNILEQACSEYTTADTEDGIKDKSGLQLAVYYLMIKVAKIVRVFHLVSNDNARATETAEFLDVLHFSKDNMIGGAIYNTNKNRNTNLRRVQNLPQLEDVDKLKKHMCSKMKQMLDDEFLNWTKSEFVELRDMACARLTLYNARRGGEPARLRVSDWDDACNQIWFDKNRIEAMPPEEQEVFAKSFVMYQTGKGRNHLVPVIVPEDTVPALKKITDAGVRLQCGIDTVNSYLFPSTDSPESNVSGWHALNRVCCAAGVDVSKITATKMRHLASTMYASLEIPESKRAAFYAHMGHSKAVNEAVYQAPLAEQEVLQVGSILQQFGKLLID
jgi:hypothetical protein